MNGAVAFTRVCKKTKNNDYKEKFSRVAPSNGVKPPSNQEWLILSLNYKGRKKCGARFLTMKN